MCSYQSFWNNIRDVEIDTFPVIQLIHNEHHVLMAVIECMGTYRPPSYCAKMADSLFHSVLRYVRNKINSLLESLTRL